MCTAAIAAAAWAFDDTSVLHLQGRNPVDDHPRHASRVNAECTRAGRGLTDAEFEAALRTLRKLPGVEGVEAAAAAAAGSKATLAAAVCAAQQGQLPKAKAGKDGQSPTRAAMGLELWKHGAVQAGEGGRALKAGLDKAYAEFHRASKALGCQIGWLTKGRGHGRGMAGWDATLCACLPAIREPTSMPRGMTTAVFAMHVSQAHRRH